MQIGTYRLTERHSPVGDGVIGLIDQLLLGSAMVEFVPVKAGR